MKDNYKVYRHTSPSGKVYIGITKNPTYRRWMNGLGYKKQVVFHRAIEKYGWNNFKHEVLFDNLNEISAKCIEVDLIYYYKQLGISYNILKVVKVKVVIFHLKKQLKSIIYQWH